MLISIGRKDEPEDLIGLLLACHERIRRFLDLAERIAATPDTPADELRAACIQCSRYFAEALPLHVLDEDESLLPRLRAARPEIADALQTMFDQHRGHRSMLAELLSALQGVGMMPGDGEAHTSLARAAARASEELLDHLELEEQLIFPAARESLPPETQAMIVEELRGRRTTS